MRINYNQLARYILDKKIEISLFDYFKRLTEKDWDYYRTIITDHWLNVKGELDGLSVDSIRRKIESDSRKMSNSDLISQDKDRIKRRFISGNKLKNGSFSFSDLKIFLNYSDPIEILIIISKKDLKKRVIVSSPQKLLECIAYLNSKRVDQYHPESSDIYHQIPFNETDIRQILIKGQELFKWLGLPAQASTFENYLSDLTILIDEWNNSVSNSIEKKVYYNLPKREHADWGFVGYEEERAELIKKLAKGNRRLFQVIGQGGSGKSALVNEVCYQIYLENEIIYNQFIWISSKADILTNAKIKSINNSTQYSNYKDLLLQLFLAINNENISEFSEFNEFEISDLEHYVKASINGNDNIKRLIVIDNLENISKENQKKIIDFLEENINSPNYIIITTRHRIIDDFPSVNIELGGLGEKHGIELFTKLVKFYQFNHEIKSKNDQELVKRYVNIANHYPLAIKYCIEKAKKDNISLKLSFETCKNGGSDLHAFIFRDTYKLLSAGQKRLLKTIVVYKTSQLQDVDKHVLRIIFNSIYKNDNFDYCINSLFERTLISYVGLSDDDVIVVLSDLITSHVEDIINRHEMDTSKIHNHVEKFVKNQIDSISTSENDSSIRSSKIQHNILINVLPKINNQLALEAAIKDISKFSTTFYGLSYLQAKLLEMDYGEKKKQKRKKISDFYLKSIRLKPQFLPFWIDYLNFLKDYYPTTLSSKISPLLSDLFTVYFNLINAQNRIDFAHLILEVLSITKTKNEHCTRFMEYTLQNNLVLSIKKGHLNFVKYITTEWLKRPNKTVYIKQLLADEKLKTLLIKNEYQHFAVISKKIT